MTFRIAFKALSRNKMRTGLTMLGMIIGVSAVITLVAMGNGAQSVIEDQIKGAGTNMITVNAGNFTSGRRARRRRHREHADARTMPRRSARKCRRAVPGRGRQHADAGGRRQPELVHAHPGHRCRPAARSAPGRRRAAASSARRTCTAPRRSRVLGTTVNDTAVRRGRRSGRAGHPHPQSAVQGDRRHGVEGPGGMGEDMDDQILVALHDGA